jgi:hypothetical protein
MIFKIIEDNAFNHVMREEIENKSKNGLEAEISQCPE